MANCFGSDILMQATDLNAARNFYVEQLGFVVTEDTDTLLSLHGNHINLFIERGPRLGPILEIAVKDVNEVKQRLIAQGCELVKDEPEFPRVYLRDPFGLIYNLTKRQL